MYILSICYIGVMTTNIDLGHDNGMQAPARASHRGLAPGFQRIRIGELLITALYDGFVPVPADALHGASAAEIHRLLAEGFMPADGDRHTAVIAFLVEDHDRQILIDTGSGHSLGLDTGYVATHLAAAVTNPGDIDHVLLTHLHPDHATRHDPRRQGRGGPRRLRRLRGARPGPLSRHGSARHLP
jgi:hypothetical protein